MSIKLKEDLRALTERLERLERIVNVLNPEVRNIAGKPDPGIEAKPTKRKTTAKK
jgi:uncharacterized protein (UPF0335 family)